VNNFTKQRQWLLEKIFKKGFLSDCIVPLEALISVFEDSAERNQKCSFHYSQVQSTLGLPALFSTPLGQFLSEQIKTFLETLIISVFFVT
jgi:hypothetical protein